MTSEEGMYSKYTLYRIKILPLRAIYRLDVAINQINFVG